MSSNWANGSSAKWRRVRAAVLAANQQQNNGLCQLQLADCTGLATEVHHTRGRGVTGDDPRFLVAACKTCNLKVGDPTRHPATQPRRHSSW